MAWLEVVHACPTPNAQAIRDQEAMPGSRWQCDKCDDMWVLRQLRENGAALDDPKWMRTTPPKHIATR